MTTTSNIAKATCFAAVISIVLNYLWNFIAIHALNCDQPAAPWMLMIGVSTAVTTIFGGIVFFLLERFTTRGTLFFTIISLFAAIVSLFPFTKDMLPDGQQPPHGFLLLAAPMHLLAAIVAVTVIPRLSKS
ncbi:MAG: DUF6069 family protein [Chitinophagales bacterium]